MSDAGAPPPDPTVPPSGGHPPPGSGFPAPGTPPPPPSPPPGYPGHPEYPGYPGYPPGAGYDPQYGPPYGPPYGAAQPPPQPPPQAWAPPVLQPGAVPLRPLGLGDLYNGAFAVLRRNAGATLGASVLVSVLAGLVPALVTAIVGFGGDTIDLEADDLSLTDSQITRLIILGGAFVLGLVLDQIGSSIVTGMIAGVAVGAASGRVYRLPEAWALTRGLRWRLVLLPFLTGLLWLVLLGVYIGAWAVVISVSDGAGPPVLFGLVTVPAVVVGAVLLWVRMIYVAVPALVVERLGVFAALGRALRLTTGSFWRLFGIALLTGILVAVAGGIIGAPVSFGAQIIATASPEHAVGALILGQVLGSIVSAATTTPFTAAVTSLQYLDLRIRREGYDVELLAGAAPGGPTGTTGR